MRTGSELDLVRLNAIRHLADEARDACAHVALGTPEHDFYAGVLSAAERHLHAGRVAVDDERWLDHEPALFRDGYLEASTAISMATVGALYFASPGVPGRACRGRLTDRRRSEEDG